MRSKDTKPNLYKNVKSTAVVTVMGAAFSFSMLVRVAYPAYTSNKVLTLSWGRGAAYRGNSYIDIDI